MIKIYQIKTLLIIFLLLIPFLAFAQHLYAPPSMSGVLNDNKMHIYLCGTGVPQESTQLLRKPACLAVIVDKKFLLFDAGASSIQTLAGMGLPILQLHHVFLTHLHSDHMAGLGEVMNGTWHAGRTQPITIYGPYGIRSVLSGFKKAYRLDVIFRAIGGEGVLNPDLAFAHAKEISALENDVTVFTDKDLKITAFPVDHLPVFPAFGYQINYKSCKIVISGDTKVNESLANHAKNADLLINEAVSNPLYRASVIIDSKNNPALLQHAEQIFSYHSDSLLLAQMAKRENVKKLVLTHLLPSIPTTSDAKKSFIEGMNQYYQGPIMVADDRDELIVDESGKNCQITYVPAKVLTLQKVT